MRLHVGDNIGALIGNNNAEGGINGIERPLRHGHHDRHIKNSIPEIDIQL
jgi:hypothetical protein